MTDAMRIGQGAESLQEQGLCDWLAQAAGKWDTVRVLELGTRRWDAATPTHHGVWCPPGGEWVKSDMEAGLDVDVVADAHDLAPFLSGDYDAYVAVSVYEHLRRPWVAAQQAARVLGAGGHAYVSTHQTFPLHGYPSDYFRFSKEALSGIFEDAGMVVVGAGYQYRCTIQPPPEVTRWNTAPDVESWLNVDLLARKP